MADPQVRIVIDAVDNSKKAIKSAESNVTGFGASVKAVTNSMKGLLGGFGAFALLSKLTADLRRNVENVAKSGTLVADAFLSVGSASRETNETIAARSLPLFTELGNIWNTLTGAGSELTDTQRTLVEAHQLGLITFVEYQQALADSASETTGNVVQQERLVEVLDRVTPAVERARGQLVSLVNVQKDFANLKFAIQLETDQQSFIKGWEELQGRISDIRDELADAGVQGFIPPAVFDQLKEWRSQLVGAHMEYQKLETYLDEHPLSPRQEAEAQQKLDTYLATIETLEGKITELGFNPYVTPEQIAEMEEMQALLMETTQEAGNFASAHTEATNKVIFNYLLMRTQAILTDDEVSNEIKQGMVETVTNLAEEWGLVGAAQLQMAADLETAMSQVAENGDFNEFYRRVMEVSGTHHIYFVVHEPVGAVTPEGLEIYQSSERGTREASGGPVTANRSYIVGDGGEPELFVPRQDGRIVPSHQVGVSADQMAMLATLPNTIERAIARAFSEAADKVMRG